MSSPFPHVRPGDRPTYDDLVSAITALYDAQASTNVPATMNALQNRLEATWQPDAAVLLQPGSVTASSLAANVPGIIINTQRLAGANAGYAAITAGGTFMTTGTTPLRLSFTPQVNCWWEVRANIGILNKTDAAYNYGYGILTLSPADADSISTANQIFTQHTSVDVYGYRAPTRIFKLTAGVAYTCTATFSTDGGTWQYYQDGSYLWIEGKAWAR